MHIRTRIVPGAASSAAVTGVVLVTACAAARPADLETVQADAGTAQQIRTALPADPVVGGVARAVGVHGVVATSMGAVPDEAAARRVLSIVRETSDVRLVVDHPTVEPPRSPS